MWRYKLPYGFPNAWLVWISPKTLCSPVLASFVDFDSSSRASKSMTWHINRTYGIYACIHTIDPQRICCRHCSRRWSLPPPSLSSWSTGELSMIMEWQWLLFNSKDMYYHAVCILVVHFDSLIITGYMHACMHAVLEPKWATCSNNNKASTKQLNKIEGWSRDGIVKMYTNKICRDNHIYYTSLHLLFSIIMHLFMSTCSCYPSVSVLDLHVGENIPYGSW